VYRAGTAAEGGQWQFAWFDRFGKVLGKVGGVDNDRPANPSTASDGRRVALERTVKENTDVWILDLVRGVLSRFTSDPSIEIQPLLSPDGTHIVFTSNRNGVFDLYQKSATGAGPEELLLRTSQTKIPLDWSPDGRFLLYRNSDPKTGYDIWALPLDGSRKPFPAVQTDFDETNGQFSPDGAWVAYQSNESGRVEIYIQPFQGPGGKVPISTNGGAQARWRHDGKELFYVAPDGRLMAVPIQFPSTGHALDAGAPVPLFATRLGGAMRNVYRPQYTVSADGQRFLMNTVTGEANASPITVVLNWKPKP
jgi:Tol biopolymer transport system component